MSAPRPAVIVRPCFEQDIQSVQFIYAHHVLHGAGTFETEPPSLEEMRARWAKVVGHGWPFLVAVPEADFTRIVGFAYAAQFRDRAAYAHTFEDSVYVAPSMARRGVGESLLTHLLVDLKEAGAREVIAVIGDSANAGSIGLHAKLGFTRTGVLTGVGAKFGGWLDVVLMQRSLA